MLKAFFIKFTTQPYCYLKLNRLLTLLINGLLIGSLLQSCVDKPNKFDSALLNSKNDSVAYWIKASQNKTYSLDIKKQYLKKAYLSIKATKLDSLHVRALNAVACQNYYLGDTLLFKKRTNEVLKLAKTVNDSFAIGDAHWNYASYYNYRQEYDSAYYHFDIAYAYFDKSGYNYEAAKIQYGMAFIKGRFKDYSGSEVLTYKAIDKFEKLDDYFSLYSSYNHLGNLQNDINEYDKALGYYTKALGYSKKVKNNQYLQEATLSNIGYTYLRKDAYSKALEYFNELLKNDSLKFKNKALYARIIDNKAFCKLLLKDTLNVAENLKKSLRIRERINNKGAVVISKIHLSNYYAYKQDTNTAIRYAKEANRLALDIENSRDYLESLLRLSKLDVAQASSYLKRYIDYSDSLIVVERKNLNKFTRIAYETDEYIQKSERLSEQKKWISVISLGIILLLGFMYFLKNEKSKNELLLFENAQQKSNEKVYLISLKQQEKLEHERVKERIRIAEELHDGVLGKLFGTRMGLGFLEIEGSEKLQKKHQSFLAELQTIEKEIRDVSHKLSNNIESSQLNFSTIIHNLLKSKSKIGNFKFEYELDPSIHWRDVNELIKVNLYRIIQEAIQNILKYALAKNVKLIFRLDKNSLIMEISDDGIGFDIKKNTKGIGLKNIKSRAKKINSEFIIVSKHNVGTQLTIKVPLKNPKHEN